MSYEIVPGVSIIYGGVLSLAIGVDRLISVLYPTTYRNFNRVYYLSVVMILCSVYSLGVIVITYLIKDETIPVLCSPWAIFTGFMAVGFLLAQGLCYGLAIVTYISIWVVLKFKSDQLSLLKPISIILGFIVGGWIFNVILAVSIVPLTSLNPESHMLIRTYAGITINVAIASEFFVFWISR